MHIIVFGDSITYGAWDKKGGWVQRLREYIEEKDLLHEKCVLVYNCGVSGDTTADLVKRLDVELSARLDDENIIIFSIGTNDCLFLNNKNRFQVDEKTFGKNIEKMIKQSSKHGKVIFIGLLPVDGSIMDPLPWSPDKSAKNAFIEKYDAIIEKICKEKKIEFIGLNKPFRKMDYKSLLEDGDHPNSKGHEKIFEIVKDFLLKENIIQ